MTKPPFSVSNATLPRLFGPLQRMTTQPCVAITRTGTVMLKSSYDEFAKSDMVDPIAGKKFKEKDVVELRKAATGFASSGKVEAEVYRPTMS